MNSLGYVSRRAAHSWLRHVSNKLFTTVCLFFALHTALYADNEEGKTNSSGCYKFGFRRELPQSDFLSKRSVPASLAWTTSGAWTYRTQDGVQAANLLLVDHSFESLLRVAPGDFLRVEPRHIYSRIESPPQSFVEPLFIASRPAGGYIVNDVGQRRILFFDSEGYLETLAVETFGLYDGDQGAIEVTAVWGAAPTQDGVFALIEYKSESGQHKTAFSFLRPSDTNLRDGYVGSYQHFDIAAKFRSAGSSLIAMRRSFYQLDFLYLASDINGFGYALIQESKPWIAKLSPSTPEVSRIDIPDVLSHTLEISGNLPKSGSRHSYIDWAYSNYRRVESHEAVTGLHLWLGRLHVLSKSGLDASTGRTKWSLSELSIQTGELLNLVHLPTDAAQVTVVAGNEFIGLIEKGGINTFHAKLRKFLVRSAESAILLPADLSLGKEGLSSDECETLAVGDALKPHSLWSDLSGPPDGLVAFVE